MDVKMKQAQADLIEEQKNNLIQRTANERTDGLLKTLDLDYFGTRNKRSVFELSNLEKYQSNAMELAIIERQRLQNNLAVRHISIMTKNMELLMKRYNLSEAEFKERVRQFNVNAARADKKLSFDMEAFERQMQNWNTQYNQGVRQFNIRIIMMSSCSILMLLTMSQDHSRITILGFSVLLIMYLVYLSEISNNNPLNFTIMSRRRRSKSRRRIRSIMSRRGGFRL